MVNSGKQTKTKNPFYTSCQGATDGVGCWGREIKILLRLKDTEKNYRAVEKEPEETAPAGGQEAKMRRNGDVSGQSDEAHRGYAF